MRLKKSYDSKKLTYTLEFEIDSTEMIVAGGARVWTSKNISDYVDMLQRIAYHDKRQSFADMLRDAVNARQQAAYQPQQQFNQQQPQWGRFSTQQATQPAPKPAWAVTLGLEANATPAEIKARYRKLAKENHPDRGGDAAKFTKINEAYEAALK